MRIARPSSIANSGFPAELAWILRSVAPENGCPRRSARSRPIVSGRIGPTLIRSWARPLTARSRAQRRRGIVEASSEQEADRVTVEATDRERDGLRRRRVEPLDVVDGDHDVAIGRQGSQRVQAGNRDRPRVGIRTLRLLAEQRDAKRLALRDRQTGECLVGHRLQDVPETRVRERRLGIGRAGLQHTPRPRQRVLDRRRPEGRLAHSRVSLDEGDPWRGRARLEERLDTRQLILSTYDRSRHPAPHQPARLRINSPIIH